MITEILSHPQTERECELVAYIRLMETDLLARLPHRIQSGKALPRSSARVIEGRCMALILSRGLAVTAHLGNVGIDYPALIGDVQKLYEAHELADVRLIDTAVIR